MQRSKMYVTVRKLELHLRFEGPLLVLREELLCGFDGIKFRHWILVQ